MTPREQWICVRDGFSYLPEKEKEEICEKIEAIRDFIDKEEMKNSVERLKRRDGEWEQAIERMTKLLIGTYVWLACLTGAVIAGAIWAIFLR